VAKTLGLRVHSLPKFINNTLFIPRFDREVNNGCVIRYGQESLTSLVGIADFGNAIPIQDLAKAIVQYVTHPKEELLEFLYRDITNLALGNTDNHGRNTAIRKFTDGTIELTPIYDLAPMILDEQGIARTCRWGKNDHGGNPDWAAIVIELSSIFEKQGITKQWLGQQLYEYSFKIEKLPTTMHSANVDEDLILKLDQRIKGLVQSLRAIKNRNT
jgi:serine/threonine-protein kinase HipA